MRRYKTCFKCSRRLVATEKNFYRHQAMADGLLGKCRDCTKKDVREHHSANLARIHEYDRRRAATIEGRAKAVEYQRRRRETRPDRDRAYNAVARALRSGLLIKGPCFSCGTTVGVEAHHADYSKPLEVAWYCFRCHREKGHGQIVI